jgi:hypothetical protein
MNVEQLQELSDIAASTYKTLCRAKKEFARIHSKLAIGDIVIANGYTHTGKKMKVERILFTNGYRGGVTAFGRIIKKDGSIGVYEAEYLEIAVRLD